MLSQRTDYRSWLRDELAARTSRNPRYSLRAFAAFLALRPSHLSEVLSGKLGLSASSAQRIAERLGMGDGEAKLFVTLIEASHARSPARKRTAEIALKTLLPNSEFRSLEAQVFDVIADWEHYAIFELVQTDDFVPRFTWIGERLGIDRGLVERAVRRLEAVGLLEIRNGKWRVIEKSLTTTSGIPSAAIRKFHLQILGKAADALHEVPLRQRDFSTMTFPINRDDVAEIAAEVRTFRRALEKKYKARAAKNEVYALSLQFFPLTRRLRKIKREAHND